MRLVLITVISLQLLTLEGRASALPQVPSTDPCDEAPCGKGAECKSMGSIAICVCPNDGTGDPFVSCMQQVENEQGSSTASPSGQNQNQFVASFDVGSVHDKARSNPTGTVVKTTTGKPSSTTRSSTTPSPTPSSSSSSTTTTRNPYVHVFDSSTSRPATVGHGHGSHGQNNDGSNQPESHRIPIINQNSHNGNDHYSQHDYPPRPMNGGSSTYSPNYPYRGGSGSSNPSSSSTSYELFNEKTVVPGSGPIADYGGGNMGGTTPYAYRGTATHLSGSHNAYEYDSRPITPTTSSYHYQHHPPPHSNSHNMDRYGHHSYHPSSSGFPGPITESSASYSRYATSSPGGTMGSSTSRTSGSGSTYDIYNYNQLRNDLPSHGHYASVDGFDRVADPMGKYNNCRSVNGIVVCADNTNAHGYYHSRDPAPLYDRGEMKTTTMNNYGSHTTRDRDHYSAFYPSRYGSSSSSTSHRPMSDYPYNVNRQGYPYDHDNSYHGSRQPIDSSDRMGASTNSYYPHTFLPKEQRISAQSTLTISSSSSSAPASTTTSRNDNDHPLCKSMCGINSVCRLVLERPVCGCPESHTGDPSVRCSPMLGTSGGSIGGGSGDGDAYGMEQCQRHIDCKQSEICAKNKCMDPCKEQGLMSSSSVNFIGVGGGAGGGPSICGTNAECLVVGHTPVCKCHQNYFGNPYVACVP